MKNSLDSVGNVSGLLGSLVCLGTFLLRLQGRAHVNGYETLSFFVGGIALLAFGSFLKLSAK